VITVQIFNSRPEAEVAKTFLEAEGITCHILADDQGGLVPGSAISHGIALQVNEEDLEEAKGLLESSPSP